MYKIGISGKARSGKDTLSKLFIKEFKKQKDFNGYKMQAFADPIKEIVHIMYPDIPSEYLYGISEYRSNIIPGAFKNNQPLTIRQILQDIGTEVGRSYNDDIWINVMISRILKSEKSNKSLFIVSDCRFLNEFNSLKQNNFTLIRLKRNEQLNMQHSSETQQDEIKDEQFDYVINNNGTISELNNIVKNIVKDLIV